jgi:uncharacterized protein YjiS (DUF1127 family)
MQLLALTYPSAVWDETHPIHSRSRGRTYGPLVSLFDQVSKFRANLQRRRAYEQLLDRPDFILRDIGVSRSEILERLGRA